MRRLLLLFLLLGCGADRVIDDEPLEEETGDETGQCDQADPDCCWPGTDGCPCTIRQGTPSCLYTELTCEVEAFVCEPIP